MKRTLATLLAVLAIALSGATPAIAETTDAGTEGTCQYTGWTIYENDYPFNGDWFQVCSVFLQPVVAARTNFRVSPGSQNLNNGCTQTIGSSGTWNDCVSGIRVINLPTGYKIVAYNNEGYSGQVWCIDTPGNHSYNLNPAQNDLISSMRVITGHC